MSYFPTDEATEEIYPGFFGRLSRKRRTTLGSQQTEGSGQDPVPLESVQASPNKLDPESGDTYTYAQLPSLRKVDERDSEETAYRGAGHIHFASDMHERRDVSSQGSSTLAPPQHTEVPGTYTSRAIARKTRCFFSRKQHSCAAATTTARFPHSRRQRHETAIQLPERVPPQAFRLR